MPAPASHRAVILLTGFGPFPGVPLNATMALVPQIAERAARAFPDVQIATDVLPTDWYAGPLRLEELLESLRPNLALHFGVSSRARGFEVEQRARNLRGGTPDIAGAAPAGSMVLEGAPEELRSTIPVQHVVGRLRRCGIPAFVSRDAGSYLCNAALFHSLALARCAPGRRTGFVHVPTSLALARGATPGLARSSRLTWEQAVSGGTEIVAACLGRHATTAAGTISA
jgi:pyroglutamyl-peptidase